MCCAVLVYLYVCARLTTQVSPKLAKHINGLTLLLLLLFLELLLNVAQRTRGGSICEKTTMKVNLLTQNNICLNTLLALATLPSAAATATVKRKQKRHKFIYIEPGSMPAFFDICKHTDMHIYVVRHVYVVVFFHAARSTCKNKHCRLFAVIIACVGLWEF